MSLKINGSIIDTIKINGSNISLGKINGDIIFTKQNNNDLSITLNGKNILINGKNKGIYNLCYANDSGIIEDYESITTLNFDGSEWEYSYFNDLNIAPSNATKISLVSNNEIINSIDLTDDFKVNDYGNKLYSVGLLSDIHIDGNGDGNNSDSGYSQNDFTNALNYFTNKSVDFVCIAGDVTFYGYDADYEAYKSIINNYSIPIKSIRGNHECYVNGSSNYDYANTKFQSNVNELYYEYTYNNDIYLFCGMYKESTSSPFSDEELIWLSNKLEQYKNKRVFLFVHYYYGDVGNVNNIVSIHKPISDTTFINLITNYKNVIYFNGHTHLAFYHQKYGKDANIKIADDICHRVHIPSCAKPRISSDGAEGSASVYSEGSEGYLMEVYEKGIVLKGINFETNKYLPIALYKLPFEELEGEEEQEPSIEYVTSPTMESGYISTSNGSLSDDSSSCRTADYIYIKGKPTLTITNSTNTSMRVVAYDENKNFMTNWLDDNGTLYSYKRLSNGATFTFPDNVYYIKFRTSTSTIPTVTIVYE
jgi:hypothetical protein